MSGERMPISTDDMIRARLIPPLGARDVVGEITETILTTVIALREQQTNRHGTPGRN